MSKRCKSSPVAEKSSSVPRRSGSNLLSCKDGEFSTKEDDTKDHLSRSWSLNVLCRRLCLRLRTPEGLLKFCVTMLLSIIIIATLLMTSAEPYRGLTRRRIPLQASSITSNAWTHSSLKVSKKETTPLSTNSGKQHPLMIQIDDKRKLASVHTLPLLWDLPETSRRIKWDIWFGDPERHKQPDNPLTRRSCELKEWQKSHRPNCNNIHEIDMSRFYDSPRRNDVAFPPGAASSPSKEEEEMDTNVFAWVNAGAYRDVWMTKEFDGTKRALKTLVYSPKRRIDLKNFDRHRRDAMAAEALTKSPYIADIYGHCGNSALFDFCSDGDLYRVFDDKPSKERLLEIAYKVAQSVADANNYDENGHPTIAHTDVKPNQWVMINGEYKLNDFNRARLLAWDTEADEVCPFDVAKNGGVWRAPEEYNYDHETEKVDVWSLGNVLYFLLMRQLPYDDKEDWSARDVEDYVRKGGSPVITDPDILRSTHPFEVSMMKAMKQCFIPHPKKRPRAQKAADVLKAGLDSLRDR